MPLTLATRSAIAGCGLTALQLLAVGPYEAAAQELRLGRVSFPNSGTAAAQEPFLRGLALLHSFEFPEARRAFREAQRVDPAFAMAYWGEAMAWNYPLWFEQFRDEALEALARYAPTPAERQARAPTDRERRWLAAVEVLYGGGSKEERDDRYETAMEELHRRYPDDPEAAAFHALAVLGTAHEGRDHRTYMRAGAIAGEVLRDHPEHPGAAHYVIHSFDDPDHAPLGLHAARVYSRIAPDADHAQHMTSHIFVALGMWDEVVRANEQADRVADRGRTAGGQPPSSCGHYNEWLIYGYLMQGRDDAALELLEGCAHTVEAAGGRGVVSFADMRSRYLIDSEDWGGPALSIQAPVEGHPLAAFADAFIRGFAAARSGDVAGAKTGLAELRSLRPAAEAALAERGLTDATYVRRPEVLELQLAGLVEWVAGDRSGAVATLAEAAEIESALPFTYGPPVIEKPSHELLGEALLARDPGRAAEAFAVAVERAPGRVNALRGLIAAAEATGDGGLAAWARAQLEQRGIPVAAEEAAGR